MLVAGIYRVLIDDRFKLSFGKFIKGIFRFSSFKRSLCVS